MGKKQDRRDRAHPRSEGLGEEPRARHVLVTRYNIPTGFAARSGINAVDPDWLAHRERLFLRFCAASVERQTVRDFDWLLLVSPATPARFLRSLEKHARLVVADGREDTIRLLNEEVPEDGRALITSRLDNDDAIAPDYIAKARTAALASRKQGRSAVVFTHGVLADIERMRATALQRIHSPFVSLIETERPFRLILSYKHVNIDAQVPLTAISTAEPMWMQTVHGRNINNHNNWQLIAHDAVEADLFASRFPGLLSANAAADLDPARQMRSLRLATMRELKSRRAKDRRQGRHHDRWTRPRATR